MNPVDSAAQGALPPAQPGAPVRTVADLVGKAPGATAPAERPPAPPAPRRFTIRVGRMAAAGVVAGAAVVAGRSSGLLVDGAALVVATLLVLLVPTSRDLARRILLAGCLLLGWTVVLWWWPLPVGGTGRVTIGLALLAGALAAWVASARRPGQRARRLLPRLRRVDILVPLSIVASIVVVEPWLRPKTSEQAMGLLLSGWDNSAHFSMVEMIRRTGVTVNALGPRPDGMTWQFDSYPQGFHAVIATLIELRSGPVPGDVGVELTRYTSAVALFVVAVVAILVAGFCALPVLRSRPALALPVAAFVATVILVGPGAHALQGGIGNFTQACVLVVAVALLVVPLARICAPLPMAALGGAVVGIATGWVLLLVLVAPALLAALLPLRRRRWAASRGQVMLVAVIVVLVSACVARTASVLLRVRADNPLTTTPGTVPLDIGLAIAACLTAAGAGVLVRRTTGARLRVAALAAIPVVGLAVYATLAGLQIAGDGKIGYYPSKFLIGLLVVALLLLIVPVVHIIARRPARGPVARVRGAVGSGIVTLALTQVFGLTVPDLSEQGLPPGAEGMGNRALQENVLEKPPATTDLVDRVGRLGPPPGEPVIYLDLPSDGAVNPILAAQWYLSLTGTWTVEANALASEVQVSGGPLSVEFAAATVRTILTDDPDAVVAVRPAYLRRLVEQLGSPRLTRRIVTF